MSRYLYSSRRDRNNQPEKKSSRKSRKKNPILPDPRSVAPLIPGTDERQRMRESQLGRTAAHDPDLEGYQRRRYETQEGVNYSEPHHLPPRHDLRKPNPIDDPDLEQDDPDLVTASLGRIAEISLRDEDLTKIDNLISDCFRDVRSLKSALEDLHRRSLREKDSEIPYHAEQGVWICEEALEGWLREIDSHLDSIIQQTPEEKTNTR